MFKKLKTRHIFGTVNLFLRFLFAPITAFIIINYFTTTNQGAYYLIFSFLNLLQIGELGFLNSVINDSDKSKFNLNLERSLQKPFLNSPRNENLLRYSLIYFFTVGIFFSFIIIGLFVSSSISKEFNILFYTSLVIGLLNFTLSPMLFIIEGNGFVKDSYKLRSLSVLFISVISFSYIILYKNINVILVTGISTLIFNLYIFFKYFNVKKIINFNTYRVKKTIIWVKSKFTFQTRLMVSYIFGQSAITYYQYIINKNLTIIEVGQYGITNSLLLLITAFLCLNNNLKFSYISSLYSENKTDTILYNFKKDIKFVILLTLLIFPIIIFGYLFILTQLPNLILRFLPPFVFLILLIITFINTVINIVSQYTRANGVELVSFEYIFIWLIHFVIVFILIHYFKLYGLSIGILIHSLLIMFLLLFKFKKYTKTF